MAQPQIVGAVLSQLPEETGDAFRRGSGDAHAGPDVKLNTLGGANEMNNHAEEPRPMQQRLQSGIPGGSPTPAPTSSPF